MGTQYTTQQASGFNASPPSDDGAQTASNLITWAAQKTKLADPIKNLADGINAALVSYVNFSARQITANDPTVAGDHLRCVEIAPTVTTAVTVSLGDAATMGTTYRVYIKNSSAISQTIGRVTGGDTIDGVAGNVILAPGEGRVLQTNNTPNGYLTVARSTPFSHGADVASAATVNLDTATGDLVDVTGTTTIMAITLSDGKQATVRFTGALTLTHGASLVLPGAASITTAAGDYAVFRGYAAGVVRCVLYQKAANAPSVGKQPTRTVTTSGSGTYTTPTGATRINVRLVGGGGGGGGGGAAGAGTGSAGSATTFGSLSAGAGGGGNTGGATFTGGAGGTTSGCDLNQTGTAGADTSSANLQLQFGMMGGATVFGGTRQGIPNSGQGAMNAAANTGAGGHGGGVGGGTASPVGAGGGSGGYGEKLITSPAATYSYAIGGGGAGGSAGSNGSVGGNGGSGLIIVDEYYD